VYLDHTIWYLDYTLMLDQTYNGFCSVICLIIFVSCIDYAKKERDPVLLQLLYIRRYVLAGPILDYGYFCCCFLVNMILLCVIRLLIWVVLCMVVDMTSVLRNSFFYIF